MTGKKEETKKKTVRIVIQKFLDGGGDLRKSYGVFVNGIPKHEYHSEEELDAFFEGMGLTIEVKYG